MVSPDTTYSPEPLLNVSYPFLRFEPGVSLDQKSHWMAKNINSLAQVLNTYGVLATDYIRNPVTEENVQDLLPQLEKEKEDTMQMVKDMREIVLGYSDPVFADKPELAEEAKKDIAERAQRYPAENPLIVSVRDLEDLQLTAFKFSHIEHDLRTRLTPFTTAVGMYRRGIYSEAQAAKTINDTLLKINEYIAKNIPLILKDQYPHENISIPLFASTIKEFLEITLLNQRIEVVVNEDPGLKGVNVDFSPYYLKPIIEEIAKNSLKAFEKKRSQDKDSPNQPDKIEVNFMRAADSGYTFTADELEFVDKEKGYLITIIEDNATGLSDETFAEEGLEGTNRGRKIHKDVIEKYGGAMALRDREGVKGARMLLALPLAA